MNGFPGPFVAGLALVRQKVFFRPLLSPQQALSANT